MNARHGTGSSTIDVGLMTIDGRDLAIPADALREIVPRPATLHAAIADNPALVGSIVVRGDVIPVVDIRGQLGWSSSVSERNHAVAILRQGDRLLGIQLSSVSGLTRILESDMQAFEGESAGLIAHGFVRHERAYFVLDVSAIFAMPSIPHATDRRSDARRGIAEKLRILLLTHVADIKIAVEATAVVSVLPASALRPAQVDAPGWPFVINYLGHEVRVCDDLARLGLDSNARSDSGAVLIFQRESKYVGWRVDRVASLIRVGEDKISARHHATDDAQHIFPKLFSNSECGPHLLLDAQALVDTPDFANMAAICRDTRVGRDAVGEGAEGARSDDRRFLVFRSAGRLGACTLGSIREIVRCNSVDPRSHCGGSGARAMIDHRGSPLPLFEAFEGQAPRADDNRLIVVAGDPAGGLRGFLVDAVCTIASARPTPVPGNARGDDAAFIVLDVDGRKESIRVHALA